LRELIIEKRPIRQLKEVGYRNGTRSLTEAALRLVARAKPRSKSCAVSRFQARRLLLGCSASTSPAAGRKQARLPLSSLASLAVDPPPRGSLPLPPCARPAGLSLKLAPPPPARGTHRVERDAR
jgi:hypothetical protein